MAVTIYGIPNCDAMKKAPWFGISVGFHAILFLIFGILFC